MRFFPSNRSIPGAPGWHQTSGQPCALGTTAVQAAPKTCVAHSDSEEAAVFLSGHSPIPGPPALPRRAGRGVALNPTHLACVVSCRSVLHPLNRAVPIRMIPKMALDPLSPGQNPPPSGFLQSSTKEVNPEATYSSSWSNQSSTGRKGSMRVPKKQLPRLLQSLPRGFSCSCGSPDSGCTHSQTLPPRLP